MCQAISYKWLRRASCPTVRGLKSVVDSEGEKAYVSPITEANVAPERNDGQAINFSSYSLACLCILTGFIQLASILHYTNKLIYLEQAAK